MLAFAGIKILTDEIIHIHPLVSVAFTVTVIGGSVWLSLKKRPSDSSAVTARYAVGGKKG